MRIWMLAAGAAAIAISAPTLAERGGGQGKSGGKDNAAQVERGGGQKARADRGRGEARIAQQQQDRGRSPAKAERAERGKPVFAGARDDDRRSARAIKVEDRGERGRGRDEVRVVGAEKVKGRDRADVARVRDLDDGDGLIRRAFDREVFPGRGAGLIAGCPPGLDKRDNGCMPPGHVKNLLGLPLAKTAFASSQLPYQYRDWYRDDDDYLYRSGDGFIYRVDRDKGLIDGLIPLMTGSNQAGYYALGDPWPESYDFYNVPYQYRSMWADRGDDCYRYDGYGAIYQTNCNTNVVGSIVSLLAGDLGVGSQLPMAYNVYNVPMAYRSSYYDTPDAWYRYNDGYIYRVDPTTRLITAVIDALV